MAPRLAVAIVLGAVLAGGAAARASAPGTWRRLPAAPLPAATDAVSVWTGREMVVFGRAHPHPPWSVDVAAAYSPATRRWRRLAPLPGPRGNYEGRYRAFWTGREMLVSGPLDFQAYDPVRNRWRRLPPERGGGAGGLVVWTGRELVDWGGGCCGDASRRGAAFDPATGRWRPLAASPLAPSQEPGGAWDGRELVVFVTGRDPDGKAYPARLARAAAYDPAKDAWRRIAPPPATRPGAASVWDGRELLVVGGAGAARPAAPPALARVGLAYTPATGRWRTLARAPSGRMRFAAVWSGRRLLVWGGAVTAGGGAQSPPTGAAYDPAADRWSVLPRAPLAGRLDPAAVWSGRSLLVWGGSGATGGASFAPLRP